jgi:sulfoxide reductase heme-binding subunit YedZ
MNISTQPATRSSKQPLGGASGDLRHRFLRFHLPIALASAMILVLFMSLPFFDISLYAHPDLMSGLFPQQRAESHTGPMGHGEDHIGQMRQGGEHIGRMRHGGDHTGPRDHGGDIGSMDHGGVAGSKDHSSGAGSMDHGGDVFLTPRIQQSTVATGYLALGLLALTLLLGPANLLLRRRNPVSSYLRRDMGMWTAIFSIVHVIFALLIHVSHGGGLIPTFLHFFVAEDGRLLTNSFGLGNWTGLAALMIVVGLLAISSDFALRKLKVKPWKWLQRLSYALFALVILHAFFYGAFLRTTSPFTFLLGLSVIAIFVGQAVGVWLWRRRYSRTAANLA